MNLVKAKCDVVIGLHKRADSPEAIAEIIGLDLEGVKRLIAEFEEGELG